MYESEDRMVSHPDHYISETGMEVIDVIEAFTFGQDKPDKKQLRDLRSVYRIYRKKLLKNSSPFQRFYICYLLGL